MTPTSELDAVNAMLSSIGESLINDFDDKFADAAVARDLLTQEVRALQNATWVFNTELEYALKPDSSKQINLPQNVLRVINIDSADAAVPSDVVQRGQKLYDRRRQSYEFNSTVICDLVVALQFDEMPEAARRFVFVRAARKFQDRMQADASLHQIQTRDEVSAWAALQNFEAEEAQWNLLERSPLNARMKRMRWGSGVVSVKVANNRD